jgi:hypothetical protein
LKFKPDLSETKNIKTKISLADMATIKDKTMSIKGARESVTRAKVGRSFREYEIVARELGSHINDCGQ